MGRSKKMISKAKTSGGVPAKVTAKQRIARKKNIAIARQSKKKGTKLATSNSNAKSIAKARLKEMFNDPIYRPLFGAKTPGEHKKAADTLISIRGHSAYTTFKSTLATYKNG